MGKPTIENPRVFISYAWSSTDYQDKVLSFATNLMCDGVAVEFDKWSLKEGNDTYAFMEQCVNDPSITNVLILLDEQYAKKADARSGGVGTETQIISPEIYNQAKQEKFIPVVFERGTNGEVYKPTYLKGLLHFDLSISEQYDEEYQRLVMRLYGIEVFQKPALGNKPIWLDSAPTVSAKTMSAFSVLKTNQPEGVLVDHYISFLSQLRDKIVGFQLDEELASTSPDGYLDTYASMRSLRDEFLLLMQYNSYVKNSDQHIASMLEDIRNSINRLGGLSGDIKKTFLHEIFLYVIAVYYKTRNYDSLSYILGKTYFTDAYNGDRSKNFDIFYDNNSHLDNAVNKRDSKDYISGTAQYWVETINIDACSRDEFIFADILCYNYAVLGKEYHADWYWFPLTYIYADAHNSTMRLFAIKLQSMEHLLKAAHIFGYNDVEAFRSAFTQVEERIQNRSFRDYRHKNSFESAPLLCHYVKANDLGSRK